MNVGTMNWNPKKKSKQNKIHRCDFSQTAKHGVKKNPQNFHYHNLSFFRISTTTTSPIYNIMVKWIPTVIGIGDPNYLNTKSIPFCLRWHPQLWTTLIYPQYPHHKW